MKKYNKHISIEQVRLLDFDLELLYEIAAGVDPKEWYEITKDMSFPVVKIDTYEEFVKKYIVDCKGKHEYNASVNLTLLKLISIVKPQVTKFSLSEGDDEIWTTRFIHKELPISIHADDPVESVYHALMSIHSQNRVRGNNG